MRGQYIDVAGRNVFYIKKGSGQPLILVHGLGNSHLQWQSSMDELSKHFTVYAFDFPGFGESDPAELDEISATYIPLFMRDLIEALGIENPVIVGGSFGGLIALHYTVRYPTKVKKLVIMDSPGLGIEILLRWRLATLPIVGELFAIFDSLNFKDQDSWLWKTAKIPLVGSKLEEFLTNISKDDAETIRRNHQNSIRLLRHGVDIIGQRRRIIRPLNRLSLPVLIMWGSEDRVFPVKHAFRAARLIPDAKLHIFNGAHHWPPKEFPDEFCRVLIDFISD